MNFRRKRIVLIVIIIAVYAFLLIGEGITILSEVYEHFQSVEGGPVEWR